MSTEEKLAPGCYDMTTSSNYLCIMLKYIKYFDIYICSLLLAYWLLRMSSYTVRQISTHPSF